MHIITTRELKRELILVCVCVAVKCKGFINLQEIVLFASVSHPFVAGSHLSCVYKMEYAFTL